MKTKNVIGGVISGVLFAAVITYIEEKLNMKPYSLLAPLSVVVAVLWIIINNRIRKRSE